MNLAHAIPDQLTVSRPGVICGACGSRAEEFAGSIPFYLKDGDQQTSLWKCLHCGSYMRDLDYTGPAIRGHFEIASYTNPVTETHWRALRTGLFAYLINLASAHLGRSIVGIRALDWGTAFGILPEMLAESGAKPEAVEIVPALREMARSRGLVIHETLSDVSGAFELITAVDSFYYANDPRTTLFRLRGLLTQDGKLILRLSNRTWYFDLMRALGLVISTRRFDDIKYNYSIDGALKLLSRSGFVVEQIYWADKGRGDLRPLPSIYYKVSPLLSQYLSLRVSPGMIIVARPDSRYS